MRASPRHSHGCASTCAPAPPPISATACSRSSRRSPAAASSRSMSCSRAAARQSTGGTPRCCRSGRDARRCACRSEEHTSELQSRFDLVCRLLLEKKKKKERDEQYYKDDIDRDRDIVVEIGTILR